MAASACSSSGQKVADGGAGAGGSVGSGGAGGSAGSGGSVDAAVPGDGAAGDTDVSSGETGAGTGPIVVPVSPTGHDRFYGVAYDAMGNIYAVGQVTSSTDTTADFATVLAKFTSAGALDTTFGNGGFVVRNVSVGTNGELFRGIVVQSTGKIVISGSVDHVGATDARDRDIALLRFNVDGTADTTFGTMGVLTLDLSPGTVNGTAFSVDSVWGLARYPDDRLLVSGGQVRTGGTDTDFVLVRLGADGARDATFGTNGLFSLDIVATGASNNASSRDVTILPGTDGILAGGYQPVMGADTAPVVYRVTDTGVLDTTFGTGGFFSQSPLAWQTESYQMVVQPIAGGGYKIVTTGYGRALETETTDLVSLRLNSNGTLDTTYGTNGVVRIDIGGFGDNSRKLVVLPDRRIMLVGGGRLTSADVDGVVAILTPDGMPDTTFAAKGWKTIDLGGPADFLWSVALSPDTKTAALVGIKGQAAASGKDDNAVLYLMPVPQ